MFHVVIESRVGDYETMPHYSVYGPYKNKGYAREVLRSMAEEHGIKLDRGSDVYKRINYHTGLKNVHYGSIIEGTEYTDTKHSTFDISDRATKFPW